MRSCSAIGHWSNPNLFDGLICECFAKGMLAIPNGLGDTLHEADHVVLPVSDMITNLHAKNDVPLVVGIEVHIERIHRTVPMIVDNDRATRDSVRLALTIGDNTVQPRRVLADIVLGSQPDFRRLAIQAIKVVQGQRIWCVGDRCGVDLRCSMNELSTKIRRSILIRRLEPNKRSWRQRVSEAT